MVATVTVIWLAVFGGLGLLVLFGYAFWERYQSRKAWDRLQSYDPHETFDMRQDPAEDSPFQAVMRRTIETGKSQVGSWNGDEFTITELDD